MSLPIWEEGKGMGHGRLDTAGVKYLDGRILALGFSNHLHCIYRCHALACIIVGKEDKHIFLYGSEMEIHTLLTALQEGWRLYFVRSHACIGASSCAKGWRDGATYNGTISTGCWPVGWFFGMSLEMGCRVVISDAVPSWV